MEKCEKKIFSCSDCEMAIIAGTAAGDPAAVEHLQNCSACREFAEFQKSVLAAEPDLFLPLHTPLDNPSGLHALVPHEDLTDTTMRMKLH